METIVNYLKTHIVPRGTHEFIEKEQFDEHLFDQLVQDGFYVCKHPPPPSSIPYMERIQLGDSYLLKKVIKDIAWLPTQENHPFEFDGSRDPIYRRVIPPPAEALDHVLILQAIASTFTQPINYLEYGVSTGHSLVNMAKCVQHAYGVDIANRLTYSIPENAEFFQMTTDQFSETHLPNLVFSMCFIDADHAFTAAYKDFNNVINYIQPGGYIILHDTYPCTEEFLAPHLCNDCYKTPIKIKKEYPHLELLTLPVQPGLTILRVPF